MNAQSLIIYKFSELYHILEELRLDLNFNILSADNHNTLNEIKNCDLSPGLNFEKTDFIEADLKVSFVDKNFKVVFNDNNLQCTKCKRKFEIKNDMLGT